MLSPEIHPEHYEHKLIPSGVTNIPYKFMIWLPELVWGTPSSPEGRAPPQNWAGQARTFNPRAASIGLRLCGGNLEQTPRSRPAGNFLKTAAVAS